MDARREWDREKAVALYFRGYNDAEIAKIVGTSVSSVARLRQSRELPSKFKPSRPPKRIVKPHEDSMARIARQAAEARKYGMSYGQYQVKFGG